MDGSEVYTWEVYRKKAEELGLELKVYSDGGFELNELVTGTLAQMIAIIDWEEGKKDE